jgi:hypothetical protein
MEWFEYLRIIFPDFVKNNMMDILPKLGPCTMISNHRPINLKRKEEPPPTKNLFKFENMWISHPNINEIIK